MKTHTYPEDGLYMVRYTCGHTGLECEKVVRKQGDTQELLLHASGLWCKLAVPYGEPAMGFTWEPAKFVEA